MSRAAIATFGPYSATGASVLSQTDTTYVDFLAYQITSAGVATVTYEATLDGVNWLPIVGTPVGGGTFVSTSTTTAVLQFQVTGCLAFRARVSAYTSGTVTGVATTAVRAS
jgi:hypothetical protein